MRILKALCKRRFDTYDNLAQEFGVSRRTIDYDISALSLQYPIYTLQGRNGGVRVVEGYYLGDNRLNRKQLELLRRLLIFVYGEDRLTLQSIIDEFSGSRKTVDI